MSATPLVLIVGMHRSGTSLLGSLLPACGITMPGQLISGNIHNPEGYFERTDITALQEQLLIDLERWWPSPRGMQPLPEGWLESALGQRALADLIELLEPEGQRQNGPWAIKDPRSSLLLPLWKAACQQLGIPLQLLLAVRDPAEVMVSLVRRDQVVTGMDGWRAQRLWWHHNAQVLRDSQGLPLQVVSYSHWFEPARALKQLKQLAPAKTTAQLQRALQTIKPEHRRSSQQPLPAPVAKPVQKLHQRLEQLALEPSNREAVERWLDQQHELPAEASLQRRRSRLKRTLQRWCGRLPNSQVSDHPWGDLAEIACGSQGPAAEHQLAFWLEHGFREFELNRASALAGPCPAAEAWPASSGAVTIQLRGDLQQWPSHAWLQRCPVEGGSGISAVPLGSAPASAIALNLSDLRAGRACAEDLLQLSQLEQVWDPNPRRVQLLRQFGVKASWLQPSAPCNGYLQPTPSDWAACSQELGLPTPTALRTLGSTLCLGSGGPCDPGLTPPLLGVPGFSGLAIRTAEQARLQALWLQSCLDHGLELVRFQPTASEEQLQGWQALVQTQAPERAPILLPSHPIGAQELLNELHWYRQGCPTPEPCHTPQPKPNVLLDQRQGDCHTAVCISLHNYRHRVEQALASVLAQQGSDAVELIVVDDASTDEGAALVQAWMERHHQQFGRCLLIQHTNNGGLASARNTAFAAAESGWCFVLDADNQLDPMAVAHCRALAECTDHHCAVIHSLIRVHQDGGNNDPRQLVSDQPWQRELFKRGNYIDAMALVRREAWAAVGGYTHIPGGWEDFDFWCCLIDAGWHGVLCPQVLATYTSHRGSMRIVSTGRQERQISRVLQARHPWLDLPLCTDRSIAPTAEARPEKS